MFKNKKDEDSLNPIQQMFKSNKKHNDSYYVCKNLVDALAFSPKQEKERFEALAKANYHKHIQDYQYRVGRVLTMNEKKRLYQEEIKNLAIKHRELNATYHFDLYIPENTIDLYEYEQDKIDIYK